LTEKGLRLELRDSRPGGADVQALAARLSESLAALAALGRDPAAGGYTPSDFPESGLEQADLDRLARSLDPALRRHIEAVYPFSPSQQGMFFFYLLNPDQPGLFVNQVRCELRGRLDVTALRKAWQTVVDRHAALRTFLLWQGWERPLQVVLDRSELPWQEEDWRALSPAEQEVRLTGFLAADRLCTFDLGRAPLTRVALIRTGEERHHLVWSFQQLILDGWSLPLVFQEVLALYDAAVSGRASRLAVGRPYRDYAAWVQRQNLADAEVFWRGRLAGFEEPTPLAVDRPAGDSDRRDAGRRELRLDADTTAALEALARRSRLTLNTVVEGAWALLLSRYSGEPDVVFGAVVAGRPAELPGVETMVGLFINALPERVEVGLDRPLLPWLAGIQERRVEQTRYEHLPLEQVHRWSALPWNRPLFETLFIFENYPIEDVLRERRGGLEISAVGVDERPNYPLNLFVIPGSELFLWVSFEHRRFEEVAVERLLGHLCELLRGFAENPDTALGAFPLLTPAETSQVLAGWNARWAERPPVSVQTLIETQAARRPAAPAVVYEGAGLTYGELNRRANRLAHHLRRLGVGPEVPVGICLERSLDLIVAVLAVMKAGGAYLPVDIALSSQRMGFVLDDAGVPVLLTRQLLARDLPARPGITALAIDAPWDAGDPADDADPPVATVPENACYLIYTSGSTGLPKGVVVRHAGWLNSYLGWEEDYRLPEIAAHLQMAAFSFDVFAGDLVRALCSGGKLVLCPRELLLEPARLYQLMRDEGVEAAEFVPAVVRGLVQHLEATGGRLDFMRLMVCGSDAWYGREFEQLRRLCGPATRLINSYGVSEATIDSSYYEDTGAALGPDALVPIGKPFRACRLLVVAPDLALLPAGVAGELCLGGAGLGRGYLARPQLTAEKFVPDPFAAGLPGGRPGDRLYRTGDRARWLPTGDVEFLGRVDHQVKVRGFRVEPGEIESVLGTHPAVRQAAVVARPEPSGERRLVGYVAFRPELTPPGIQELRDSLRERLPDYMVPSAFVVLDALPLTASGKIDRRALPEPEGGRPDLDASYVAPRTQAEEVIAGIFAAVLNLQRVGVEDNFFELGGHSLLATQVVSRVREAFEVDLPLRALFDAPVVARLVLVVEDLILRELEELGDDEVDIEGEAAASP
jgi:amino acid adenylation domain-containing protein